jgi:Flp pilus assembly protein TadG
MSLVEIAQMKSILSRVRRRSVDMLADCRGIAATEFAVIVPIMLVMFFGTVEFSSGVAVDAKVTLMARTLSDITSRSISVVDSDLTNFFTASIAISQPYSPTPVKAQVSEIYVDSNSVARVQWSKAATIGSGATQATLAASSRVAGDLITLPPELVVKQTYVIFSEVSYRYIPTVGYVMAPSGVNLSDVSYTRPRKTVCVTYNNVPAGCPTP